MLLISHSLLLCHSINFLSQRAGVGSLDILAGRFYSKISRKDVWVDGGWMVDVQVYTQTSSQDICLKVEIKVSKFRSHVDRITHTLSVVPSDSSDS